MQGEQGPAAPSQALELHSKRGHSFSLPWEEPSTEQGMPGRSQQGQLLQSDDELSEDTDSNVNVHQNSTESRPQETLGLGYADHQTSPISQPILQGKPSPSPVPKGQNTILKDESGTDTDEDGELIRARAKAAQEKHRQLPKKRAPGKTRVGAGITLGMLIKEGILWPGKDVLSVEYKSVLTHASLTSDGQIICNVNGKAMTFESPSAFSIFLKRTVNPNRKADDGWKTVKFNGRFLETYKLELAKRKLSGLEDNTSAVNSMPPTKKVKLDHDPDTQRSQQRPGASSKGTSKLGSNLEDENQMIPCERYRGLPGSKSSGCQPFRVFISPAAALFMDFHSHLSKNEIIGLLAGSWDGQLQTLRVERAFPVLESQAEVDTAAVEMNQQDEACVRSIISKQYGLRCLGWYHSHPHAAIHPSTADILQQIVYQKELRKAGDLDEPFIGAIIAPNPGCNEDASSQIGYFHVEYPRDQELSLAADPIAEGCLPMAIEVDEKGSPAAELCITSMPQTEMRLIAQRCASSSRRADLYEPWKDDITWLAKLKQSVSARLPEHWPENKLEDYVIKIDAVIAAAWKTFAKSGQRRLKADDEELEISDVTQSEEEQPAGQHASLDDVTDGSTSEQVMNGHRTASSVEDVSRATDPQNLEERFTLANIASQSIIDGKRL